MNAAFANSVIFAKVELSLALTVLVPVTLMLGLRLPETQPGSRTRRLVIWMLFTTLLGGVSTSGGLSFYFAFAQGAGVDTIQNESPRCAAMQRNLACVYILSTLGLYMVLIVRAEISLDRKSRTHMLLFNVSRLGILVGIPSVSLVGLFVFDGRVDYGTCTLELAALLSIAFSALDFVVSVMLLLLFYIPVRKHLAVMSKANVSAADLANSRRIHSLARKSLRLSLVQMVSTLAAHVTGILTQAAYDDSLEEFAYFRVVRHVLYYNDLFINVICMMAMGSSWVPRGSRTVMFLRGGLLDFKLTAISLVTPKRRSTVAPSIQSSKRKASSRNLLRGGPDARPHSGPGVLMF